MSAPSEGQFGACCGGGLLCHLSDAEGCSPQNFFPGQSCFPSPCPLGACCAFPLLTCTITDAAGCNPLCWNRGTACNGMFCGDPDFVACCRGAECSMSFSADCVQNGGFPVAAACSPQTCNLRGCCGTDGSCVVRSVLLCVTPNVILPSTTCTATFCDLGACCIAPGNCVIRNRIACEYFAAGSTCMPEVCGLGACCRPDGVCFGGWGFECAAVGGRVIGGSCAPDPCVTGSCCVGAGFCTPTIRAECPGWWAAGQSCGILTCSLGACCTGASCTVSPLFACGGTYQRFTGVGSSCVPYNLRMPCCRADADQNGIIALNDIFAYLQLFFLSARGADTGDSGTVEVQDIFDFLAAWFTGC